MSVLFAATYPERVSHLILFGGFTRSADLRPPDDTAETLHARIEQRVKNWGNGTMLKAVLPSLATHPDAGASLGKFERLASSPGALRTVMQLNAQIDVT